MNGSQEHWDDVYSTKKVTEVSWYEPMPQNSLDLIAGCELDKDAAIIDVGGGDSFLADFLLKKEFTNITVLDISEAAIERAKERMGEEADQIKWVVTDITEFEPTEKYDLWHDRAAFHFLTDENRIRKYMETLKSSLNPGGFVILGTFSDKGPTKCSGLDIKQYSIGDLLGLFSEGFENINCKNVDHTTPSGAVQNFSFCSFRKI